MRLLRRHVAAAPLLVAAAWLFSPGSGPVALADAPVALAWPAAEVALAETTPQSERTLVRWVSPGGGETRVAEVEHPRDASVKGAVLPGTRKIALVVDADAARDRSFASALMLLEAGAAPVTLAREVAHAATPVATDDGRLLVERGAKGKDVLDPGGKLAQRVDDLEVSEVDPATGASHPVFTMAGYTAHVAGAHGDEALVYAVGPRGAELVAVNRRSRALRVVADVGPLARDFSVDRTAGALVFSARRRDGTTRLTRVDLASGSATELAASRRDPVPFVLPGGGVLWTDDDAKTTTFGAGPRLALPERAFFWGKAASGGLVAGLVMPEGALPTPVLVAERDGAVATLPRAEGVRVEVLGLRVGGAK